MKQPRGHQFRVDMRYFPYQLSKTCTVSKIGHDDWPQAYHGKFVITILSPKLLNTSNINHGLVGYETALLGPKLMGVFKMNGGWY